MKNPIDQLLYLGAFGFLSLLGTFYFCERTAKVYEQRLQGIYEISEFGRFLRVLPDENLTVLFEGSREHDEIRKGTFFIDGGEGERDGKVDTIIFQKYKFPLIITKDRRPVKTVEMEYHRSEDFNQNPDKFLEADKKLAEAKEHFKKKAEYFPKNF